MSTNANTKYKFLNNTTNTRFCKQLPAQNRRGFSSTSEERTDKVIVNSTHNIEGKPLLYYNTFRSIILFLHN
jgi:hypothetical protein